MGIELKNQYLYTFQFVNDQAIIANDKEDMHDTYIHDDKANRRV